MTFNDSEKFFNEFEYFLILEYQRSTFLNFDENFKKVNFKENAKSSLPKITFFFFFHSLLDCSFVVVKQSQKSREGLPSPLRKVSQANIDGLFINKLPKSQRVSNFGCKFKHQGRYNNFCCFDMLQASLFILLTEYSACFLTKR